MERILLAVVIAIILIKSSTVNSDLIPPQNIQPGNYPGIKIHTAQTVTVARRVRIQNLDEFPDIIVIQYVHEPFGNKDTQEIVNQNAYLPNVFGRGSCYLLWSKKSHVDSIGLSKLPISEFINCKKNPMDSSCSQAINLLDSNLPLADSLVYGFGNPVREDLFYSLYRDNKNAISFYLAKKNLYYSNGNTSSRSFSRPSGIPTSSRSTPGGNSGK
jgi:hypothetical protein